MHLNVMEWIFLFILLINIVVLVSSIMFSLFDHNNVAWNSMILILQVLTKYKITKEIYNLSHLPSGQDVLSSPQQTGCGPSLANGVHLVSARHPGGSFPVHHLQEAVPKLTNDNLFPSLPWSAPFCST